MNFHYKTDAGGFDVEVRATFIGADLLVTCTGGDKPHIGAVAVAHPRDHHDASEPQGPVANIICLSGHREDELARSASLKLCNLLETTVTVVAGMHWREIDKQGIEQVVTNVENLIEELFVALSARKMD